MEQFILALDQGTSSSRAIIFDHEGNIRSTAQMEFTQYFPKPGWVEHNPMEIWSSEAAVIAEAITKIGINGKDIAGIGITNQRETTIVSATPSVTRLISSARRRASSSTPTSPAPRSVGSWTTFPAPGRRPRPASSVSAPWTAGSSGSSRGAKST